MCCGRRKPVSTLKRARSELKKRLQSLEEDSTTSNGEPTANPNSILPKNQEETIILPSTSPYDVQESQS